MKKVIAAVLAFVLITAVPASFASANIYYPDFETGETTTMYCFHCGYETSCEKCVDVDTIEYTMVDDTGHNYQFAYRWVCTQCNNEWSSGDTCDGFEGHSWDDNDACTLCGW